MIKKICFIKNVGKFRECNAVGDVEFSKLTLAYSENARGKTTLTQIIRSLSSGDSKLISERQTLGSNQLQEIQILSDAGAIKYSNGKWSQTLPDVMIFDDKFVRENVYSGNTVESEHRRNLLNFVLGIQAVEITQEIKKLDNESREYAKKITEKEKEINRIK